MASAPRLLCVGQGLFLSLLLPILADILGPESQSNQQGLYAVDDYDVLLNSSSPACLDSHVKFTAHLVHTNMTIAKGHKFVYSWIVVDELKFPDRTESNEYSEMFLTLDGESYPAKYYLMEVNVFKVGKQEVKVASGNITFYLGENLIFDMKAQQDAIFRKHPHIFSTEKNIQFDATLMDNFTDPIVYHSWNFSGPAFIQPIVNTTKSSMTLKLGKTGKYTLMFSAIAEYNVTEWGPTSLRHKEGNLTYSLELKDPVTMLNISITSNDGEDRNVVNRLVNFTITCNGSPPFELSWNISSVDVNASTEAGVIGITTDLCEAELSHNFSSPGNYTITIGMANDVSNEGASLNFTILPKDDPVAPVPAYIPVFCVIVGLSVIITILVVYYKEHRRHRDAASQQETANFDFLSVSSHSSWDDTRNSVKNAFQKLKEALSNAYYAIKSRVSGEQTVRHSGARYRNYGSYGPVDQTQVDL